MALLYVLASPSSVAGSQERGFRNVGCIFGAIGDCFGDFLVSSDPGPYLIIFRSGSFSYLSPSLSVEV